LNYTKNKTLLTCTLKQTGYFYTAYTVLLFIVQVENSTWFQIFCSYMLLLKSPVHMHSCQICSVVTIQGVCRREVPLYT